MLQSLDEITVGHPPREPCTKRECMVFEIADTEAKYVHSLGTIVEHYMAATSTNTTANFNNTSPYSASDVTTGEEGVATSSDGLNKLKRAIFWSCHIFAEDLDVVMQNLPEFFNCFSEFILSMRRFDNSLNVKSTMGIGINHVFPSLDISNFKLQKQGRKGNAFLEMWEKALLNEISCQTWAEHSLCWVSSVCWMWLFSGAQNNSASSTLTAASSGSQCIPVPAELADRLHIVWGNIRQIYEWHRNTLLPALGSACYADNLLEVANCFIKHVSIITLCVIT